MAKKDHVKDGLDGLVVAETVLSRSDAQLARLWIRGVPLDQAVRNLGFEGLIALLWSGFAGDNLTLDRVTDALARSRQLSFERLHQWSRKTKDKGLDEATRQYLAAMPDESTPAELVSALVVGVPALIRFDKGLEPITRCNTNDGG